VRQPLRAGDRGRHHPRPALHPVLRRPTPHRRIGRQQRRRGHRRPVAGGRHGHGPLPAQVGGDPRRLEHPRRCRRDPLRADCQRGAPFPDRRHEKL
ncbi:MAG: hypothetical protein AVDCRST_MAG87-464, partial [uncultured Thermomicrobiales bacterium]